MPEIDRGLLKAFIADAGMQVRPKGTILQGNADREQFRDEESPALLLDKEQENPVGTTQIIPSDTNIGITEACTTTYCLVRDAAKASPALVLVYDPDKEDRLLFGMLSLIIRW
jgi:hypothetical protein